MKILLIISLFILSASHADIGLKLRQQQQQQQYLKQFGADARNNPFFIPNNGGNFGGTGAAATNVEQRAANNNGRTTERTHTLEELCNDAFHSFLCKPVNTANRRRIDGNLRPGAQLPPGFLRPESSNQRENKLLPPQQSASSPQPNRANPYRQPNDLQVPAAQNEQGYFYPKPNNNVEFNRPLQNGYLPPDNGFRYTPPPTIQTTRFPLVTTLPPQTTRYTFPTTTRPPLITSTPFTRPPAPNNFDIRFQTTPRPVITTRLPPTRPTTIFTTPRPIFTQPIKYELPPRKPFAGDQYLPPVQSTFPPQTTRAPIFTRPTPAPTFFTTRPPPPPTRPPPPPPTRPPPPPPTFPPIRLTSTFRPSTLPPVTFITTTPKYEPIANTYLPPFAAQNLNPISVTTTTIRPTFQTVNALPFNPFPTFNSIPDNNYLPPENPAIDVRFGSASNTNNNALIPQAAQSSSVAIKPDEEIGLERLCSDAFHSFLCQPVSGQRYRYDGNLRPQAVIPPGVLLPSSSFNAPVRAEFQSASNPQPTRIPTNATSLLQSAQNSIGYVYPTPSQQTLILPTGESTVGNTGYYYPAPADNSLASVFPTALTSAQTGYEYPKPNNQFNIISTTLAPETVSVTERFTTVSTTPKPLIENNQLFPQNNLLTFQNTNNQQFLVSTERATDQTGYEYPKPSFNQQFALPASVVNTGIGGYSYPKAETEFVYSTTTPRPTSGIIETSTPIPTTFSYQPTGPQITLFTGYENPNPSNEQGVTISTTEGPSSLAYEYQNQLINQVSPSIAPSIVPSIAPQFINFQNPSNQVLLSTVSTQQSQQDFNGYNYPKPAQPLQPQQTINNDQGYFYPKPAQPLQPQQSINDPQGYFYPKPQQPFPQSFPDNNLNSVGNVQYFKNSQIPNFSFAKGAPYTPNPRPTAPTSINDQLSSDQGVDPRTAKNINQLLGPSNEASNRDLPPASQFEVLKVRKRQNG